MKRAVAIVLALGAAALIGLDRYSLSYMGTHPAGRDFVLSSTFDAVLMILGGLALSMIAFGAIALLLFPRPAGRTASEAAE
ncbi:hypothetical protein [Novosphingobium clariflavum]|uniref:Uncharacterized protein n=1 Tax=Novosphingobium clariflavum TaxID=2029884 RepID=A0ABV6S1D5_9SPHN|nr:hypothetical protein [Novosphingobium clariflavum]